MPTKKAAAKATGTAKVKAAPIADEPTENTKHAATQSIGPDGEVYYFDDSTRRRIEGK